MQLEKRVQELVEELVRLRKSIATLAIRACHHLPPSRVEVGSQRRMKADGTQIRAEERPVGAHQGFAAGARGPCGRDGAGQPVVCRSRAVSIPFRHPVARFA